MKKVLILLVFLLTSCNPIPDPHGVDFILINNSSIKVGFCYPSQRFGRCMWGAILESPDLSTISPSDTLLSSLLPAYDACSVEANTLIHSYSSYNFDEIMVYDTLRIFVIGDWNVYNKPDEYLVRYDISTDDAYELMNGNGEIEICYPPDERMKDIKMWPRYSSIIDAGTSSSK